MSLSSIKRVGLSLSVLFAVSYVLCVIWDLVFPGWAMYTVWQGLLPGFGWTIGGFLIGLAETIVYGFYVALVFVPVYTYLYRRDLSHQGQEG